MVLSSVCSMHILDVLGGGRGCQKTRENTQRMCRKKKVTGIHWKKEKRKGREEEAKGMGQCSMDGKRNCQGFSGCTMETHIVSHLVVELGETH